MHRIIESVDSDITIYSAGAMSKEEIDACLTLIQQGGAVDIASAARELPLAHVAVVRDDREIVGVGAIKRTRPDYASRISQRSAFDLDKDTRELGYMVIKESHRGCGLSKKITAKLMSDFADRPIFATTSNDKMKRTLQNAGFVRHGEEWAGNAGQMLSLWICCEGR